MTLHKRVHRKLRKQANSLANNSEAHQTNDDVESAQVDESIKVIIGVPDSQESDSQTIKGHQKG